MSSWSQDTLIYPIENAQDPTLTQPQSFDLGDPSSVEQTIVYDPSTGTYVFKETIGDGLNYRNPSMMTLEEYLEYERKKSQSQLKLVVKRLKISSAQIKLLFVRKVQLNYHSV